MKAKSTLSIVLSLLLICLFTTAAFAEESPYDNTTTARVTFSEGDAEFGGDDDLDDGMHGMDIDFGTNEVSVFDQTFTAEPVPSSHTLRVLDSRKVAGDWKIMLKLSEFTSSAAEDDPFMGTISLHAGTPDAHDNDAGKFRATSAISVRSGDAAASQVAEADPELNRGIFDVTWGYENIKLFIDAEEMTKIGTHGNYSASMIWTMDFS